MKVFTAPEPVIRTPGDITCFLAGGISKCPDWQKEVINELYSLEKDRGEDLSHLIVMNPRRESFNVSDVGNSYMQIEWEFNHLESADIFSMYFCSGESVQPICLYELGRNLVRMQQRFPESYDKRIVLSVEENYIRSFDVICQTNLAMIRADNMILNHMKANPIRHAHAIAYLYKNIIKASWAGPNNYYRDLLEEEE